MNDQIQIQIGDRFGGAPDFFPSPAQTQPVQAIHDRPLQSGHANGLVLSLLLLHSDVFLPLFSERLRRQNRSIDHPPKGEGLDKRMSGNDQTLFS